MLEAMGLPPILVKAIGYAILWGVPLVMLYLTATSRASYGKGPFGP